MQLSDFDLTQFQFDPSKDYELNKLIKSHQDFQQKLGADLEKQRKTILRYIILMYDIHSPLRIMFSEDFKRKREAAVLAGFKMKQKNRKLTPSLEDILIGKNPVVNEMIIRYVLGFYNPDYLRLVVFKEMLGQMARNSINGQNVTPQNIKAFNELSQSIEQLQDKIFGSRESKELKEELYKTLEEEYFNLHPDMVAKEMAENEKLFEGMGDDLEKGDLL